MSSTTPSFELTELEQLLYLTEFQNHIIKSRNRAILQFLSVGLSREPDKDINWMSIWYKHYKLQEKK